MLSPVHSLVGFFYGSSQASSRLYGAGAILVMAEQSFYKLWMNCSLGSNTKGELLSLWIILRFSSSLGLDGIHIYGDSKIIVDWAVGLHKIRVLHRIRVLLFRC